MSSGDCPANSPPLGAAWAVSSFGDHDLSERALGEDWGEKWTDSGE